MAFVNFLNVFNSCSLHKKSKAASDMEYPAYGVTGKWRLTFFLKKGGNGSIQQVLAGKSPKHLVTKGWLSRRKFIIINTKSSKSLLWKRMYRMI